MMRTMLAVLRTNYRIRHFRCYQTPFSSTRVCKVLVTLCLFLELDSTDVEQRLLQGGERLAYKLNLQGWQSDRLNLYFHCEDKKKYRNAGEVRERKSMELRQSSSMSDNDDNKDPTDAMSDDDDEPGAISTAWWLLNRILDGGHKCIEDASAHLTTNFTDREDEGDGYYSDHEQLDDDSFALLPVVSESDDESDEDAMDYTSDYFTPSYDVCMLSVNVQARVDPLQAVPTKDCRLCRAASECTNTTSNGIDLNGKARTLSFTETDCSSDGSVLSVASEFDEDEQPEQQRTEQWLYVRL
ncbi:Pirin-like protein [Phytophthora palmivora]|uniref:Pirin-like protein n=1 Tax=Phytophthora palmivora TaxID=4796 RepID=A0A2P4X2F5_9STRA|nr:Pirin-like protein [Phytophthora palmivora]